MGKLDPENLQAGTQWRRRDLYTWLARSFLGISRNYHINLRNRLTGSQAVTVWSKIPRFCIDTSIALIKRFRFDSD